MIPSICIEMIYPELSYEKRIEAVARHGFRYIEFWSWKDKNPDTFLQALQRTGIQVSNYSGQRKGDLIREDQHPLVEEDFLDAVRNLSVFKSPTLMVLAQELGEGGRVVRPVEKEAGQGEVRTLVRGIRRLLSVLERERQGNTTLVFEPLNTRLDHPGYAVSSMETAERIYDLLMQEEGGRAGGETSFEKSYEPPFGKSASLPFGILLDLYHQGMMGDDLLNLMPRYIHCVKYVHVADIHGRHEPSDKPQYYRGKIGRVGIDGRHEHNPERIDWLSVLQSLADAGYAGFVGFEFQPAESSDRALERIAELWSRLQ